MMNNSQDLSRQPCPDRILEDVGGAFAMGAVGGSLFHLVKGLRNSPNGHRLPGGATAVRMNAPRVGGSFAVWGGIFSTFDCAMVYARKKEDPWNSIVAGAATGGVLALRQGLRATGRGAVFGGAVLALIEAAGIMLNRSGWGTAPPLEDVMPQYPAGQDPAAGQYVPPGFLGAPPAAPIVAEEVPVADPGARAGWFFGGLFGRKQQDRVASGDRRCEELELDLPSTAVPSLD